MSKLGVYKNKWDDPFTGRVRHECGGCRGRVSAKATVCRHCGAVFINLQKKPKEDNHE